MAVNRCRRSCSGFSTKQSGAFEVVEINAENTSKGPGNILAFMKLAYWTALFIIAVLVGASYSKFDSMMRNYERDRVVLETGNSQLLNAQNIVSLSEQLVHAEGEQSIAGLRRRLSSALEDFKSSQPILTSAAQIGANSGHGSSGSTDLDANLNLFNSLDARAARLLADIRALSENTANTAGSGAKDSTPIMTDARKAYEDYRNLTNELRQTMWDRIAGSQKAQRQLFLGTLIFTALFAVLIFGPIASLLARKTRELIAANNKLAFTAAHDELTGLHNRSFLADHFETVISGARRRNERVAIMQIDLDLFKGINDTLGHAAGDTVLVKTAERLRDACRSSDLCVRMGGDEFLIVLIGIGDTNDMNRVAQRIITQINQPISHDGVTIPVAASAGISVYPVDGDETNDLLIQADLALYNAKDQGGGSYRFFSEELRRELENRRQLEIDLRSSIEEKSFVPHFQPQLSLPSRKVTGMEALMRWQHPERGLLAPGHFLKVAQQTGLIVEIGRIVIDKAIAQAAQWHREGTEFGQISLNVSDSELREPDFADFLFSTLKKHRLPAKKLALEIIETVILDDDESGIGKTLREIRRKGVQIELDDFGTGYASLSHVNSQQVDRLKIDRRFVANIDHDPNNSKIVRAISELARGLGLSVVAEGAETESELALLSTLGCDEVQGFSIAYPMPDTEATAWLEEQAEGKRIVPLGRAAAG
jgi:diguanylate cyclase (GGDEF)-like protein